MRNRIISWIKKHKLETLLLVIIVLTASFVRFYRISEYMNFLGDEGRDALVIKGMLENHHFPLLGPVTSVGNMYLGPLYYYMMLPGMTIFYLNPAAAAGTVALIGVLSVVLIYYLARKWFGFREAFVASLLYALSPVMIVYSKSSWNPDPTPFFCLLAIAAFDKAHESRNFKWLILTGGFLAGALQMHYLAAIMIPVFLILWIYEFKGKEKKNYFGVGTIGGLVLFALLMSPLLFFDLRHNFLNFHNLQSFLLSQKSDSHFGIVSAAQRIGPLYQYNLFGRYLTLGVESIGWFVSLLALIPIAISLYKKKVTFPMLVLIIWLIVGLLLMSFYPYYVYDHYLLFLSPVPYFLLAWGIYYLKGRVKIAGALVLIVALGYINLAHSPLRYPPNHQLQRTQKVAQFVIDKSEDRPYNFALIAQNNYDAAYQFYFDVYKHKPKQVPFEITDQLFVVCEDPVCEPINNRKYEIAAFGWAKIESEEDFGGVKVFKLIHNRPQTTK